MPAGYRGAVVPPQASLRVDQYAFFLDFDGTLIEHAPLPSAVTVDPALLSLLLALRSRSAMALVSGRSIADLDTLLAPLHLPMSGLHGFERRAAKGAVTRRLPPSPGTLADVRGLMARLAAQDPRLIIEDKKFALALHYRQVPHLESALVSAAQTITDRTSGAFQLLRGSMVVELTPRGVSKASAVAEFMGERPFRGRVPLYIGNDPSDEPAFEWVNAAGGQSVAVNVTHPSVALAHLPSVSDVRAWLRGLVEGPG
jgi:trehalose 6-phosphate phosphatase